MPGRHGNPDWMNPLPMSLLQVGQSSFEAIVKNLGLSPSQYRSSPALKQWAIKNKSQKYAPPELLEA